jgi:Carboxypeptidase regulatory-like domain
MDVTPSPEVASQPREDRMSRSWLMPAALLLALIVCSPAGFAQKKGDQNTRSVQGTVLAADDAVVNGAVVQLKDSKSLQIRSFITKENGSYYFHGLSPDIDYELRADYQGASSGPKTLSSFDSRKDAVINLRLNKK